ncbi:MAG: CPBP family intramembrane metalloprotease, partial [Lachnospiraceae bacterium]|nr:CPBP family intramembrane metalloprotease [Lachnospiraceae bacterium]
FCGVGFSGSSEAYNEVHKMQYGVQFAAGLILYGIISPLAEEAVFRGILYNRMKRCFHYKIALVVSSLLFGIYHGNLVQAVYGSILGLLIAYFYEQYKSFAAPVLFHAAANISMFAMTYQDRLADIGRNRAMIAGTGFIVAAAGIFFYMKRCIILEK